MAYDGRVVGIAQWVEGESGPTVRFFDEEFGALTEPMLLDLSAFGEVIDMDLAGSVDVNGRLSHWILGLVVRDKDGGAQPVVLNFEGCWLE